MIICRQYGIYHKKKVWDIWTEIREILQENSWNFGELSLRKHGHIHVCSSADEAERVWRSEKYTEIRIEKIAWQNLIMTEECTADADCSPESIVIMDGFFIMRIVRTDADKQDLRIAETVSKGLGLRIKEHSFIFFLSESEKKIPVTPPEWNLSFPALDMRKISEDAEEGKIYTCSMFPVLRVADIPDRFFLTKDDGGALLETKMHTGHIFHMVFCSDKNSSFISAGVRLESPTICSGYYVTAQKRLHICHWAIEAASREEVKAFVRQCICRGNQVAAWLDERAEKITQLSLPPWFEL